ncbi:MAG: FHA domain-containing protein [Lentisphaeria bacterium]|nr:FHA domain-containing protein [Lentisphaeria bacterium]
MPELQTQNMTLMFVDIPSVGTIREARGEAEARDCQQRCLNLLGDVRRKYAGNLVRSIGGTLLCSFVDAGDAVDAAAGMQKAMVSSGLAAEGVSIRMGLHTGTVQIRGGNYSGEVVTTAARMITLAKPGCVVATAEVKEQAGERLLDLFVPLEGDAADRLNLALYEIQWRPDGNGAHAEANETPSAEESGDPARSKRKTRHSSQQRVRFTTKGIAVRHVKLREIDATMDGAQARCETRPLQPAEPPQTTAARPPLPPDAKLCLIWREKVLVVDATHIVRIGREPDNDVVLQISTASRHHAEVSFRDGLFVIADQSANGTFIYDEKGEEYFVRQGEARLWESGAICPGCPQEEPGCEALLYWMAG